MAFELLGKAVRRFRLPVVDYINAPIIIVPVQEGDVKTRYFDVTLYDDNGDVNLSGYVKAKLNGTTPSGIVLTSEECKISPDGKNVIVQFSGGFTATPGRVACDITFLNDSNTEQLTSQTFYVIVSPSQSGKIIAENVEDYNQLLSLLKEVSDMETRVETAEDDRVVAEQARVTAERERITAESARASAEQTRATEFATVKENCEAATERANTAAAEFDKKLDKVASSSSGYRQVYGISTSGSQVMFDVDGVVYPNTIPIRDENGRIKVGDPTEGDHAANMRYVNNSSAFSLEFSVDNSTFILTATLKNANGEILGTPQTVDLPLESVVVNGSYDAATKSIILTLQNGNTVDIPVSDLIDGLASKAELDKKLDKLTPDSTYPVVPITYTNGTEGSYRVTPNAVPDTIASRDSNGRLKVSTPVNSTDAANKDYVDNNLSAVISEDMADSLF